MYLGVAQLVARYLGVVEAASSSLVTQTSSEVHNEPPNFLYFTGFFGLFCCLHRLEIVRYFFAQNRLKIGYDHMFDHICHEKAIFHKGFRHISIFILCKMTAVLCFENRRFKFFGWLFLCLLRAKL